MFTRETTLTEIRDALECTDNYCEDIQNYFSNYENMLYGEAIDKFKENILIDRLTPGRVIVNLVVLSKYNEKSINDELIFLLLINRAISHMQGLLIWRKIKNLSNISNEAKHQVILAIKGKLPNAEKEDEWKHLDELGIIHDGLEEN